YRFHERAGKAAALNHGLKQANGEFIVFVDSDTTFHRDSIFELLQLFADEHVGGASGNLRARNANENLLTILQQIEYIFSISIGRRFRAHLNILPIISGAFGGFRKELITLETIGGHEPGPGNDSDLAIRIRKQGYRIVFIPEAICLTNVPNTLSKLMKQRQRWDRNIIKNRIKKHKNVFNPFQKQFRVRDALSFVDSIFYHVILAAITVFYIFDLVINFPEFLPFILPINYVLYFVAELYELIISAILSRNVKDLWLAIYLPLYNPYKIFLKFVRLIAYTQEFFFNYSKNDPFAPYKVRRRMIEW
ncbi:MAG: glycosyltransferase family 2 protein, partial [Calditrichaeota bacterium]